MAIRTRGANGDLAAAISLLVQNQAALVAQHTAFVAHLDEDRQRFARIVPHSDSVHFGKPRTQAFAVFAVPSRSDEPKQFLARLLAF